MIYYIVYFFTKFVSWIYFPWRVSGWEHIPRQGGFIIASNHVSNMDPVVLGISCLRRINFMAKDSLFHGVLEWLLPKLGAFPVKRGETDVWALKEAIKRLKKGKPVLIFVEGTRRLGDGPSKAEPGVGFLAVKAKVPVIPVHISGTEKVLPPGKKKLTRHPVTITFGSAVAIKTESSYQAIADAILSSIHAIPRR